METLTLPDDIENLSKMIERHVKIVVNWAINCHFINLHYQFLFNYQIS